MGWEFVGMFFFLLLHSSSNYNKTAYSYDPSLILSGTQIHLFYRNTAFVLSRTQRLKEQNPELFSTHHFTAECVAERLSSMSVALGLTYLLTRRNTFLEGI